MVRSILWDLLFRPLVQNDLEGFENAIFLGKHVL